MTLKKAIEILDALLEVGPQFPPDDRRDAVKLGIEAGKAVEFSRGHTFLWYTELLPGETEK